MNTQEAIDFVIHEIESSFALFYSYIAFAEALKTEENTKIINSNYKFWKIHFASLQRSLFIYLGRLSDDGKECNSFTSFKKMCFTNLDDFNKVSFIKRKPNILEINPNYFIDTAFPTEEIFGKLFALSTTANQYLRAECKTIRSKVFAHAILEKAEQIEEFQKIDNEKIEQSLKVYYTIATNIWESYHNATPISLEIKAYPDKEIIKEATFKMIK